MGSYEASNYEQLVKALRDKFIAYDVTGNHNSAQLYKDAAAAIEELQAEQKKTVTQIFGEEQMAWEGRCKDLMHHIEDLQAQLPKQGEWIVKGANRIDCSVCGHSICFASVLSKGSLTGYNYCPNCGAYMRKMEVQE